MYYLGGGGGGEDFKNQYSIFSYPPHSFPKISSPPERMDQILLSPFTRIWEFLILARYAMTVVHCSCHVGGGGIWASSWSRVQPSETLKIWIFRYQKEAKKPLLLFIFCCVIGRKSKENLPKFTRWLRKTDNMLRKVTNYGKEKKIWQNGPSV